MRKLFILFISIYLILFILCFNSACKKNISNKAKIWADKVSIIEDLNSSACKLYLSIYIDKYTPNKLEIEAKHLKKATLLNVEDLKYNYCFEFEKTEFILNSITIKNGDNIYNVDIGRYELKEVEESFSLITSVISPSNNELYNLQIIINNSLDRTIYLSSIKVYSAYNLNIKIASLKMMDVRIYQDSIKSFAFVNVDKKDYKEVAGILKLTFTSSLKEYTIYASFKF